MAFSTVLLTPAIVDKFHLARVTFNSVSTAVETMGLGLAASCSLCGSHPSLVLLYLQGA